ncbi:hypothetical protein ACFW0H_02345 [Pseudomonas sp. CR3202]|uniref:GAP1-N1 domain-containing protein n=1 Tax=Pseudomonas sp. CR3202 TaxID=3351532 RepID=UPI003BF03FD9
MESLDEQLHGYRQGHQLLSSTARLPRDDQDLIDRLSDIAGPLGPNERFSPYVTFYPLPSGSHYVVARTWQDLDAPRAGCVRTRSVLVPMPAWVELKNVAGVVGLISNVGAVEPAKKRALLDTEPSPLADIDPRHGIELVEALFLEERAPIVVFDSDYAEILTLRVVTALWPSFRRNFSASTFCRSPRSIGRRSFDLVFAPKDARSRFGDWLGRRIDGRKKDPIRHQWSKSIAESVLATPYPSLKTLDSIGEMSADGAGSESALRVSLLWEDLKKKSRTTPNAALGLLDIASTRSARKPEVIRSLEPILVKAARMATSELPSEDAWKYLKALVSKLSGEPITFEMKNAIAESAARLTRTSPGEAIRFTLSLLSGPMAFDPVVHGVCDTLDSLFDRDIAAKLADLEDMELLRLSLSSPPLLRRMVQEGDLLPTRLARAISRTGHGFPRELCKSLRPMLVDDSHAALAEILFESITQEELKSQIVHTYHVNGLRHPDIRSVLLACARRLGVSVGVRDTVSALPPSRHIDLMLEELIGHKAVDLEWLLFNDNLAEDRRQTLLYSMLSSASRNELKNLLSSTALVRRVFEVLGLELPSYVNLLSVILKEIDLPVLDSYKWILALIPRLSKKDAVVWTLRAIELSLKLSVSNVSAKKLAGLLNEAGSELSGSRFFAIGLSDSVPAKIAERNIEAMKQCKGDARKRLCASVDELAEQLARRLPLDLSLEATEAVADLLWESNQKSYTALERASIRLLPYVLTQPSVSASPLIPVTFPIIYLELARDTPSHFISMIFRFGDWDKCRTARQGLIDAFMKSDWRIVDIATAAARSADAKKILEVLTYEPGGYKLLEFLSSEIDSVPGTSRGSVRYALSEILDKD